MKRNSQEMKNKNAIGKLRTLIILLSTTIAIFTPGLVAATGNAVVSVSVPVGTVEPGEQFTININVQPNNAIAGMQFDLSFNPDIVTIDSITEGNLLTQHGASTYFNTGTIDNVAGTVTGVFGVIISSGQAITTAGTFAVITMTAGSSGGSSPLTLSNVIIGDIDGNSISVTVNDGTVSMNQPPVLYNIGNHTVNEGELLTFTVSANDPDGDTLMYSASGLPSGATFNPATKIFTWTPSYRQAGSYSSVHFTVYDNTTNDTEDIVITVNNVYQTDINGDGIVNVLDIINVAQHWNETGVNGWITEDINENGTINVLDVILIGQNWTG
jgi:hypothetical protein